MPPAPDAAAGASRDRAFLVAAIAIAVLATVVPDLIGHARATPERRYVGPFTPGNEINLYYSFITQVRDGAWLFEKWNLSKGLVETTRCHHNPALASENVKPAAPLTRPSDGSICTSPRITVSDRPTPSICSSDGSEPRPVDAKRWRNWSDGLPKKPSVTPVSGIE